MTYPLLETKESRSWDIVFIIEANVLLKLHIRFSYHHHYYYCYHYYWLRFKKICIDAFYFCCLSNFQGVSACAAANGGCSHFCVPKTSGYECVCPTGLTVKKDGKTCEDSKDIHFLSFHTILDPDSSVNVLVRKRVLHQVKAELKVSLLIKMQMHFYILRSNQVILSVFCFSDKAIKNKV